mgnify:CR=1 FL=1
MMTYIILQYDSSVVMVPNYGPFFDDLNVCQDYMTVLLADPYKRPSVDYGYIEMPILTEDPLT